MNTAPFQIPSLAPSCPQSGGLLGSSKGVLKFSEFKIMSLSGEMLDRRSLSVPPVLKPIEFKELAEHIPNKLWGQWLGMGNPRCDCGEEVKRRCYKI